MADKENKTAGAPIEVKYYKVAGPGNYWFPREIQADLADEYEALWEKEGKRFEEIEHGEFISVKSNNLIVEDSEEG